MNDLDFSTLGQEIGEKIEQFINSREMKDIQDNIRRTVEGRVGDVRRTVEGRVGDVRRSARDMADYMNKNMETHRADFTRQQNQNPPKSYARQLPVVKGAPRRVAGILLTVLGFCGAFIGWSLALLGYIATSMVGMEEEGMAAFSVFAVFAAICTAAAVAGGFLRSRAGRFRKYIKITLYG